MQAVSPWVRIPIPTGGTEARGRQDWNPGPRGTSGLESGPTAVRVESDSADRARPARPLPKVQPVPPPLRTSLRGSLNNKRGRSMRSYRVFLTVIATSLAGVALAAGRAKAA